ncbi:MAG: GNAT family N-acetyltransferase [Chloroflexi bacterium]|nr:GNAT family N-acetyltransferase [Chloroflexota bacterium]
MGFTFRLINESDVRAILNWHYEVPYDIYDPGIGDPIKIKQAYLDLQFAYHVITNQHNELDAYCCFGLDATVPGGNYKSPALDIGLSVRPDLTGQGKGDRFIESVIDFAVNNYTPEKLRVTIAEFNARARRVWGKAGFKETSAFQRKSDSLPFVILTLATPEV